MNKAKWFISLTVIIVCLNIFSYETPNELFTAFFQDYLNINPESAVELGLTADMGYKIRTDTLNDVSLSNLEREIAIYEKYLKDVKLLKKKKMTEYEKTDIDILEWYLNISVEKKKFLNHDYLVTHMFDIPLQTITNISQNHNIKNSEDADAYLKCMSLFKNKIENLKERILLQSYGLLLPPKVIFEKVENSINAMMPDSVDSSVLYSEFRSKLAQTDLTEEQKNKYLEKSLDILSNEIYPAMKEYKSNISSLKNGQTEDAGVWKLKDGDKYYEWCLKYHTTTNLNPDQIHKLGLKEVKRIHSEIMKLYTEFSIDTTKGYRNATESYWKMFEDSALSWDLFYADNEYGRKAVIDDYNRIVDDVYPLLSQMFLTLPKAKVIVEKNPEYKSASAGAYYVLSPLDRSKPGIFYINLKWLPDKPGMQTLAYHETIPGHHLQIALQQENENMHMFRNMIFCTAYIEGWALYAEKIAYEAGWFKDTNSKISYLQSELFRAVRLVLDTGIHSKRWTREMAGSYMQDNLGWKSYGEIDRYIVWPGQACAYKIGELKIIELRTKAQKALKEKFDIREFHDAVLKMGPMPLYMLEKEIDKWIKSKR